MQYRSCLVMALVALILVTGASVTGSQIAQGASVRAVSTWAQWGNFHHFTAAQPQPEPAHWVPTLGPDIPGTTDTEESTNWSGIIDTGPQFAGVSGQWVVPAVQPSGVSEASATWIGIDGATNSSLIQTGTSQDTSNGLTTYFAWYEILPAVAIAIGYVSPGDQMQASIVEDSPGTWTISIADVTSGQSWSGPVSYAGPGSSAEWIEEAPSLSGQEQPLANFGTVQFSNMQIGGTNLDSVVSNPVDMIDGGGNVIAYPGNVVNDSFTITYSPTPT